MNIVDYIKWRGDIPFKVDPFNEVDNVCLSQMIYTIFDDCITPYETITIEELADRFFKKNDEKKLAKSKSFIAFAYLVLKEMARASRFKDLKMHSFISTINEDTTEQFCAAQIEIDRNTTYVVFRGTDDTLLGWQEDFKISYELIEAEKSATQYLNKVLAKKIILGGHSKGGTLAVYAASTCKPKIQKRIQTIYTNDGPGLNFEFIDKEDFNKIKDKIIKIVPKDDVIGIIFDNKTINHVVVDSNQISIMQHDAMSWLVERNRFVRTEQLKASENLRKEFNRFIANTNNEERKNFTVSLFKAVKKAGIKHVSEFQTGGIQLTIGAFKEMASMNSGAKDTAMKFIQMFGNLVSSSVSDTSQIVLKKGSEAFATIGQNVKNTIDKLGKKK